MNKWLAWLQAARITSAINIQLPLAFGNAIAYSVNNMVAVGNLWWLFLYGIGMQLYIVFLNDWSDRFADALNEAPTMFSGGSRVLV
ncbi:MAG: prenyltransferase, partial [Candidatus Latescibacterota bacterium]|nr:prenyltransferase [Candidatus Latescibacterota bacterium]